ncbi:MAG: 50S ribosomal protein L18 [Actinomycetota bacterium]|jgi:large subunit ribosomal protein L18|nr:50S ribosomal protein L18 [Actinomycetota bacterium]
MGRHTTDHKVELRLRRHARVRRRIAGTTARPRLAVYRSNKHISAQVIDDGTGRTLAAASSVEASLRGASGGNIEAARAVGALVASRAREAGITTVVFDRGGFTYHGRVAALADAARAEGLEF